MTDTIRIAIAGLQGRMGQACQDVIAQHDDLVLVGGWGRGQDPILDADVILDMSTPAAVADLPPLLTTRQGPAWVIAVTGLDQATEDAIAKTAQAIPVVKSGNFSLGINLLLGLAAQAQRALPPFKIDILDVHHIHKQDAPSGTALMLQRAVGGDAKITSRREGEVIGDHQVTFTGPSEVITLGHKATDRKVFAEGACQAARWVTSQPAGLYDMQDVLDLK